jgi:hypothetical protein
VADLEGQIDVDPAASGDVTITYSSVPYPLADTWTGSFTGPDTLEGSFQGSWVNGSQGFDWTATFSVTR